MFQCKYMNHEKYNVFYAECESSGLAAAGNSKILKKQLIKYLHENCPNIYINS